MPLELDLPELPQPKELPQFPERHLLLDLPKLDALPELLPTDTKVVIGMIGWAAEAMPKGESRYCHFPTGTEDIRYFGDKIWERTKVTALDDIRPYSQVIIVDDKRNVIEKAMMTLIQESVKLNDDKNIKKTFKTSQFETAGFNKLAGLIYADQDLTVYVEQSIDGKNWDEITKVKTYTAESTNGAFSVEIIAPYARVRIVNASGSETSTCRKFIQMSAGF